MPSTFRIHCMRPRSFSTTVCLNRTEPIATRCRCGMDSAIKLIRSRAVQLGINPERVALFGFSAGGHLASTLTLHSATDFGLPVHDAVDTEHARPELLGLGYPVISMDPADVPPSGSYRDLLRGFEGTELQHLQMYLSGEKNVTAHTPPVFLFESMDDARISPQNSVFFVAALRRREYRLTRICLPTENTEPVSLKEFLTRAPGRRCFTIG